MGVGPGEGCDCFLSWEYINQLWKPHKLKKKIIFQSFFNEVQFIKKWKFCYDEDEDLNSESSKSEDDGYLFQVFKLYIYI